MATYIDEVKLGEGGFGEVWRCRRKEDGKRFAKKTLLDGADDETEQRFAREIRLLRSLDHPNIVEVVGKRLETRPMFYVMPLYNGSLRSFLSTIQGDEKLLRVVYSSILDAVEYAHSQGVIHRDLKPENVLMDDTVNLVVSDFGLCRKMDAVSTRATATGQGMGTPYYCAPEQFSNFKDTDQRSDIYALGKMLYELYLGHPGFGTIDFSGLPTGIRAIVTKCIKNEPDLRYQTVTALKQAWHALIDAESRTSRGQEAAELRIRDVLSDDEANELLSFIEESCGTDDDALHEFLIKTTTGAVGAMYSLDPDGIRRLIKRFGRFTAHSGWGFDYTDRIGAWCHALIRVSNDSEMRTDLAACVLEVGAGHNRYYVMDLLQDIFELMTDPGEQLLMREKLGEISPYLLEQVTGRLSLSRIPRLIAEAFEKE